MTNTQSTNLSNKSLQQDLLLIAIVFLVGRCSVIAISLVLFPERHFYSSMCNYDCNWYASIWVHGYATQITDPNGQANWAFFPLFPILIKGLSGITSSTPEIVAFLFNNACFLASIVVIYWWVRLKVNSHAGVCAALLLALAPTSIYFSIPYTESLFFLLLLCCFLCARSGLWLWAGLFGALASATRNIGVFLVFPLAMLANQQIGFKKLLMLDQEAGKALLAILLVPAGLFAYMYYLQEHVGNPFAFKDIQETWGRTVGNPIYNLSLGLQSKSTSTHAHALFCFVGLFVMVWAIRAKYHAEALFMAICILVPLSTGTDSMPRYVAVHYVSYVLMGVWLSDRQRTALVFWVACTVGMVLMNVSWVLGREYMI